MTPDDLPREWSDYSKEDLLADMEELRKAGLIEVVGINEDGDWLYGLTEKSRKIIDDDQTGDPWAVISHLLLDTPPTEDEID